MLGMCFVVNVRLAFLDVAVTNTSFSFYLWQLKCLMVGLSFLGGSLKLCSICYEYFRFYAVPTFAICMSV